MLVIHFFLLILMSLAVVVDSSPSPSSSPTSLIVLDIDNTLYQEKEAGIEKQIVQNTHSYCQQKFNMSPKQADELYKQYGSTVEGLLQTLWKDIDKTEKEKRLKDFFEGVYMNIDYTSLLLDKKEYSSSTGYSHSHQNRELLRQLLKYSPHVISVASNSPSWHVKKVLRAMGLSELNLNEIITPDQMPLYPSKNSPDQFFASMDSSNYEQILVYEDSEHNLHRICRHLGRRSKGIHITPDCLLVNALVQNSGLLDPSFEFDQVSYLKSKNVVDRASIDSDTYNKVVQELDARPEPIIRIADVGAGLLSMLDLFLHGDENAGLHALAKGKKIQYTAYESNKALSEACRDLLDSWGFTLREKLSDDECLYQSETVELRFVQRDFDTASSHSAVGVEPPHLIVGCCFSDLIQPGQLVPSLIRSFNLLGENNSDSLLYFPITFAGITQFFPPKPFEESSHHGAKSKATIPSDTIAFGLYSKALVDTLGHNLSPNLLQDVMKDHGIALDTKATSDWKIDPEAHSYLFNTMLHFFGTTGGPLILQDGWDAVGWINRARNLKPKIHVSNVDLLFRTPKGRSNGKESTCRSEDREKTLEEIQFTGPRQVTTSRREIPALGRNQVLVESSHSLISSGTELKIFNGLFDDAALDVTIEDMKDERMAYPMSYGYCLVGHIIECGSAVSKDHIGKLVFSFSPHSSHVVTDIDSIQFVPYGISPEDAIFMPSVETALSVVHDAHVRIGENVAVYGQGLIGLLITSILKIQNHLNHSKNFGLVTTFDTIPDRLAASAHLGASQALLPGGANGPFDVSIEVSGNARALQSAIDCTTDGGRIIVASWYGNKDVNLKLGIDFHRSHKTIRTSQVSEIPAGLLGTWNKQRRFALTWELVKQIRPSTFLLSKTTTLKNASAAYEALNSGTEIAVGFVY